MKIIRWMCFFVPTLFPFFGLIAGEYDVQRGSSPTGTLIYLTSGDKSKNKVWLSLTEEPKEWVKLCTANRKYLRITFSPDEQWVLISASDGHPLKHSLRLFKRRKGRLHYSEMPDLDIGDDIQNLIQKESGDFIGTNFKGAIPAAIWSADSAAILLCVTGEAAADKEIRYVNPWFCVYDIGTGKIGFDISKYHFDLNLANLHAVRNHK